MNNPFVLELFCSKGHLNSLSKMIWKWLVSHLLALLENMSKSNKDITVLIDYYSAIKQIHTIILKPRESQITDHLVHY